VNDAAAHTRLDPLSRLAIRHGTDKWGQHLYTPIYHRLFQHLREEPIRILEIGVGWPTISFLGGASLRMWRDYFPYAQIVGLDLQPKRFELGPRVQIVQGSQSDPAFLRQLWATHGPFDIVIDDGSHRVSDVMTSFETLYELLPENGFYVVEDVQTAFWPEFGGRADGGESIITKLHELVVAMHAPEVRAAEQKPVYERYGAITAAAHAYRNMIVFERGANVMPSNRQFPIEHPAVKTVLAALEQERAREPSAGDVLIKAGLMEVAGEFREALNVIQHGLRAHNDSWALLCLYQHLTQRLGLYAESLQAVQALLQLVPDEPVMLALASQLAQFAPDKPADIFVESQSE
jgi:hypothetical protein